MILGAAQIILSVLAAAVAVYFIHEGFKYTRMIGNIFQSLVYNPPPEAAASSRGERVVILDSADHEIEALWVESRGSRKVAIFCPESGSTKDSWEKYAYFLPESGFHVLAVDFSQRPAVGGESVKNSLSQWPSWEDVQRLEVVIRWAKKALGPDAKIALYGVSKGANIALAASFHDAAVKAVVADGLFSMKEIFRDYIRRWAPILVRPNLFGENYPAWVVDLFANLGHWNCQRQARRRFVDVEKLLQKKHVPLLVIHGELDDYVPVSHQKLLERLNQRTDSFRRLMVEKAGHNQAVQVGRQVYEKEISEFLRENL